MQGPEPYLKALGIEVRDLMRPGRRAVVDSAARVMIGHDIFYFADAGSRSRFLADPLRYCKRLTDPVTLARFQPTRRTRRFDYRGRRYYFAAESTFVQFRATPDSFAVRRGM